MNKKERMIFIKKEMIQRYKNAQTELQYKNDYELLIAIILSAQCTDKRVNIITPSLFKSYPDLKTLSQADIDDVKNLIKTCSFFNNKANNIIKMSQSVMQNFNAKIPHTQKELITLSGVGQKTANVFLSEFLGKNFMAVDTHVFRVSHRLKISNAKNVLGVEKDLTRIFKTNLHTLHQAFVLFGRYICKAIKPQCEECFLKEVCSHCKKINTNT